MDWTNFSSVLDWVIAHGYTLIFLAMLIDGPIVTAAGTFAVVLGYFNLPAIFTLSVLGDLVADVVYYFIGYFGRQAVVDRFGHFFGLTPERIKTIEDHVQKHSVKTLLFLKLMPVLPTPGLMAVGVTRMPIRKYVWWCTAIILPKTIFFMIVGYYFGAMYNEMMKYFETGGLVIFFIFILVVLIQYLYSRATKKIAARIDKI